MTFAEILRKARVEAGYTQEELAYKLSISRSAITNWEGDREFASVGKVE